MNVAANIGYSLKLRGWPRARIAARVEEMLSLVRLEGLGQRGPTELSGGQIQRAALARALAAEPSVLLLDEPLSALDLKLRQHMQLELRAIQRELGATFVYVTHDQTEALVMSDRIAIMNQGRIIQQGTPREIYTRPGSVFASDFIGETNLIEGTVQLPRRRARDAQPSEMAPWYRGPAATTWRRALGDAVGTAGIGASAATGPPRPSPCLRIARDAEAGRSHGGDLRKSSTSATGCGSGIDIGEETVVWSDLRDEEAVDLTDGVHVAAQLAPHQPPASGREDQEGRKRSDD